MRLWAELYCPGQGPVVDSCNRDYKHTEFVNKLSNHQLLNEVTALVSIYRIFSNLIHTFFTVLEG